MRAAMSLCIKECLLPLTFPLSAMTMEQLRQLVTRRDRLDHALHGEEPTLSPSRKFAVDHGPAPRPERGWDVSSGYLLPGGRWRIDFPYDGTNSWLFCWEMTSALTSNAAGAFEQYPTVTLQIGISKVQTYHVQSEPETNGVAILVHRSYS